MHFSSPTPIRMNMSGTEAGVFGVFTFVFCSIKQKILLQKAKRNQVKILNFKQQFTSSCIGRKQHNIHVIQDLLIL